MTVGSVGVQSGQSGYDLGSTFDVQYARYSKVNSFYSKYGPSFSFESGLTALGADKDVVLLSIENKIEGDVNSGNGVAGDLLNWSNKLESKDDVNDVLFMSQDGNFFTEVDFSSNSYKVMDENAFATELGLVSTEYGKAYDVLTFDQNSIQAYEFKFTGAGDGNQNDHRQDLTAGTKWGRYVGINEREVDTSYWSTSGANDPTTATNDEQKYSLESLQIMINTMPIWQTEEIKNQLSGYKEGTTAYNQAFFKIAIKLFDQNHAYTGTYK